MIAGKPGFSITLATFFFVAACSSDKHVGGTIVLSTAADADVLLPPLTLTLLGKNANLYAQVDAPGTIDQLVDALRDKYHRPVRRPIC